MTDKKEIRSAYNKLNFLLAASKLQSDSCPGVGNLPMSMGNQPMSMGNQPMSMGMGNTSSHLVSTLHSSASTPKDTVVSFPSEIKVSGYSSESSTRPVIPKTIKIEGSSLSGIWNFNTDTNDQAKLPNGYGGGGASISGSPCCLVGTITTTGANTYNLEGAGTIVIKLNECVESQVAQVIGNDGSLIGCLTFRVTVSTTNGVVTAFFSEMSWSSSLLTEVPIHLPAPVYITEHTSGLIPSFPCPITQDPCPN